MVCVPWCVFDIHAVFVVFHAVLQVMMAINSMTGWLIYGLTKHTGQALRVRP